jgi:CheY-like chemotaxis protein
MLLEHEGYTVAASSSDDDAMERLETESFDLILIGRNSKSSVALDKRLRAKYPTLLTLKIDSVESQYPSRITDAMPTHLLETLREMLA